MTCVPASVGCRLPRLTSLAACALLACLAGMGSRANAQAEDPPPPKTPARGLWIAPSLSFEHTASFVDTVGARVGGWEWSNRLSPGLRLTQKAGQWEASVNYTGNLLVRNYRNGTTDYEYLNTLDSSLSAELARGWLYFSGQATVSQQPISVYLRPVGNLSQSNDNRTEVLTLSMSPYAVGTIAGLAEYQVRFTGIVSDARSPLAPDSRSGTVSGVLSSLRGSGRIGWSIYGSRQQSDFSGLYRTSTTDQGGAELSYRPDVDWRFHVRGGQEYSDVGTPDRRAYQNIGGGVRWTPSPRTQVVAEREDRYFGRSHRILVEHRLVRSSFRYSDSRDVVSGSDAQGFGRSQTLFQVLFLQLAAIQPDPGLRALLVLDLIRAQGRDPNEQASGAYLVPGVSLQRRQELTAAYTAPRLNASLSAFRTHVQRIDEAAQLIPSATEPIDQSGYNASVIWRLTPIYSASLGGGRQLTQATSRFAASDNKTLYLTLSGQLTRRVFGLAGVRYTVYNTASEPVRDLSSNLMLSLSF